ncbi:SAM-dependent methyltransferase [Terriglobus sp.]|uniref:SAM-dependent methyltransferase n=1 Tax=Terriglobus sp. TaxID=1889013 RepID=UPI003B00F27A
MSADHDLDPSSAEFFAEKYRRAADPWNFATSEYEQCRYDAILAALRGRHYGNAFEPGCSVGALTEKLAAVCDHVEAIDFAVPAVATARQRCPRPQVTFRVMGLPERLPLHGFDLLVLSEIGYYFTPEHWTAMVASMAETALPGTTFLAAHWLGVSPDHRMSGDEVHAILRANPKLQLQHEERHAGFRLDRLERVP